MDALRLWGNWMSARHPASDEAMARYAEATHAAELGRIDQLEALYSGCLDELERADEARAASANHNLAVALQQRGDLDGALFHCVRGLFLYHRTGDRPGTWAGLRNLAVLFQAKGESRKALDAQRQAAQVRADVIEGGGYPDQDDGRDAAGEPLLLLSVAASRRRVATG